MKNGHKPNGDLRGHKADIYEGGHRVPFIVRWPGIVAPGSKTERLTSLSDFYATASDLIGAQMRPSEGVDSVSFLRTLKGETELPRGAIVNHSIEGSFAIRDGDWKLCMCPGSGGWSDPRPGKEADDVPRVQLFNLARDPAETENLEAMHPERVTQLTALLESFIKNGRSTDGPAQKNDAEIDIHK